MENKETSWTICPECYGRGKKSLRLRKKASHRYQIAMKEFEKNKAEGKACVRPKITQYLCDHCRGSGLIPASSPPIADLENYPHVAIIGAGIGGVALAVACLHRGSHLLFMNAIQALMQELKATDLPCNKQATQLKDLAFSLYKMGVILHAMWCILQKEKKLRNGEGGRMQTRKSLQSA